MKYFLLSLSLFILGAAACKKDTTYAGGQLPDTSSSGKNFLACKVNGETRVYSGLSSFSKSNGVTFNHLSNYVLIFGSGVSQYKEIIKLHMDEDSTKKVVVDSTYILSSESGQHHAFYQSHSPGVISLDYLTSNNSGWVRFSRLDSIASGTFAFTAYYDQRSSNRTEPDTVRITEGRFDISRK